MIRYTISILAILFMALTSSRAGFCQSTVMSRQVIALTLDQALELAMGENRRLERSIDDVRHQELSLSVARSDFEYKIGPSGALGYGNEHESAAIGASVSKKFKNGIRATLQTGIARSQGKEDAVIDVSLRVPLLKGFGIEYNMGTVYDAQFFLRTTRRSLYRTMVHTALETVRAFYAIVKDVQLVDLYRRQVERFQMHVRSARLKEQVGLATRMDVYRAEIRLKDTENSLNLVQEALSDAQDDLKLILALPMAVRVDAIARIDFRPVSLGEAESVKIALNNRIELEQVRDEIKEARRHAAVAKENLKPQLDLAIHYNKYAPFRGYEEGFNLNDEYWSVRLVSDDDWRKTAEKAIYSQHLIGINDAKLHMAMVRDQVIRGVRQKLESIRKLEERIAIQHNQVINASNKLLLAQVKFTHGMANNFDVIESENELQEAKAALLDFKVKHIIAKYEFRSELGTLVDRSLWARVGK